MAEHKKEAQFAVAACRIQLGVDRSRSSGKARARELVRSRLATLFSVPQHREFFFWGWPSEPILADAAARVLCRWSRDSELYSPLIRILDDALEDDILDRDEIGEVAARTVLLMARDSAAIKQAELNGRHDISGAVPVKDFLKELLHADAFAQLLEDNAGRFEKASINFTHWEQWIGPMSADALRRCFYRHEAIFTPRGQKAYDFIIPLYNDAETQFCLSNFSVIVVQCKCAVAPTSGAMQALHMETEEDGASLWGAKQEPRFRDFIALVMELGCKPESKCSKPSNPTDAPYFEIHRPPETKVNQLGDSDDAHRYGITIYGCDRSAYQVLKEDDENMIERLLAKKDVISSHPRQDDDSLKALGRMRPYAS